MKAAPHRHTPAIIKLSAIENNVKKMRAHIGEKPELWAVVKANAYGHGAVAVAQHIDGLVDGFCVSNFDEAIELRQQLIIKPILVLSGIVPDHAEIAASQHITLTAPSLEWLQQVIDSNKNKHFSRLRIHIAVDTGMGRIGVTTAEEANKIIELADKYKISVRGIFTHYATADEEDTTQFEKQKAKFEALVSQLSRRPKYVHSTNSAAGLWQNKSVQDIERIGLAMYGLNPSGDELELPYEVEPALSLHSELTHVKKIHKGDTVGYGATFRAEEDTYVGTVSIGYADGWTRDMQGFKVLVEGEYCEIIGRISMDQMTIRLPKDYDLGTTVTLIGKNGDKEITVQDIANWRNTIGYEVICLLSDRIYRVYEE